MKQRKDKKGRFIGSGEKIKVLCSNCKKERLINPCRLIFKNHFCSTKCKGEWQKKNLLRENNPRWNGGIHYSKDGYRMLYLPDHSRSHKNGYVYEHILVMEKKIGRKVSIKWHIHHLNGIRNDNRPENLALVKPNKHERNTIKKILQARIRELEIKDKK